MKFYIVAALLLLAATLVELRAKAIASEAAGRAAELSQLDEQDRNSESQRSEIQKILQRAGRTEIAAGLCCVAGIGCWFVSRRRKEKGTQVVPIVLAAAYFLMFMIQT
jgi:hypothetical protein